MFRTRLNRKHGHADSVLRVAIVALTLATAYIHLTLSGLLFTLNAIGYLVGAVAMVIPLGVAVQYRWLIRIGLAGYAATTIGAWVIDPSSTRWRTSLRQSRQRSSPCWRSTSPAATAIPSSGFASYSGG